jgi:hypothetical protein
MIKIGINLPSPSQNILDTLGGGGGWFHRKLTRIGKNEILYKSKFPSTPFNLA